MKKSLPLVILIIFFIALGVWLGTKFIFKKSAPVLNRETVQTEKPNFVKNHKANKKQVKKPRPKRFQNHMPKEIYQEMWSNIDLRLLEMQEAEQDCQNTLNDQIKTQDFLDPTSGLANDRYFVLRSLDLSVSLLSKGFDIQTSAHENLSYLFEYPEYEVDRMRLALEKSRVCQGQKIMNLTQFALRSFAKFNDLDAEDRKQNVDEILGLALRASSLRMTPDNLYVAMEILSSLVDNQLVVGDYSNELRDIRDDMILLVQDFESEYSLDKSDSVKRELHGDMIESLDYVGDSIENFIEKIQADMEP